MGCGTFPSAMFDMGHVTLSNPSLGQAHARTLYSVCAT